MLYCNFICSQYFEMDLYALNFGTEMGCEHCSPSSYAYSWRAICHDMQVTDMFIKQTLTDITNRRVQIPITGKDKVLQFYSE